MRLFGCVMGLALLFLDGCSSSSRPTNGEAIKQVTAYIQNYQVNMILASSPLSKFVHLKNLLVTDSRQTDPTNVEMIFTAEYQVLESLHADWVGQCAPLLGNRALKKGEDLTVTGISFRFQKYDQRGWVLAR